MESFGRERRIFRARSRALVKRDRDVKRPFLAKSLDETFGEVS